MAIASLVNYPLLDALRLRQSRCFGLGTKRLAGLLPFSEDEDALLALAACGITGHALGDLT